MASGVTSVITCPSTPGVLAPLLLWTFVLASIKNSGWRSRRYSRLKRLAGSSLASFVRCPSSWTTSTMRSITFVCLPSSDGHASGPSPCAQLSHAPWVVVTPPTTTASLSHVARYCPSQPSLTAGKATWFPGSCLVTGMGSGWLPNTFPHTGGLRTGPLTTSRRRRPTEETLRVHQPRYSLAYSSPGIIDRVCQPWVGHVSPSPITG